MRIFESIHHPHLINHFGVEVHREEMLIFMEYCPEGTLEVNIITSPTINHLPLVLIKIENIGEGQFLLASDACFRLGKGLA